MISPDHSALSSKNKGKFDMSTRSDHAYEETSIEFFSNFVFLPLIVTNIFIN